VTRDDIIRMANKAGFEPCRGDGWPDERLLKDLKKFANLVAAAEREACAQIAEQWLGPVRDRELHIAAAIRARGKG
jgi:hypothetical protein